MTTVAAHAKKYSSQSFLTHEIVSEKELLITAPEVLDSNRSEYPGSWSFGSLMEGSFGKEKAPKIVVDWLREWNVGDRNAKIPGREGVLALRQAW
jgi:hypothetical protein